MRDELLNREVFATVLEAQVLSTQYCRHYNTYRPHSGLSYEMPSAFAEAHHSKTITVNEPAPVLT